jgi:SAM-dependent methyltransferase
MPVTSVPPRAQGLGHQERACICCQGRSFQRFRRLKGFDLYRCGKCRFVTVHPLPDSGAVEAHYNETRTGQDKAALRRKLLAEFMLAHNNPKRDFFDQVLGKAGRLVGKPSMDILEIGSGFGYFVQYANSRGHRSTGTEVTQAYAEMSSDALDGRVVYVEGDRYTDQFPPASFDLVYMEHVFEHMLTPEAVLPQILQLLRPEGVLFLAVPNMDSLSSRLQGRHWAWAAPPDHLYFYNRANLSLLLERHGFAVVEAFARDYHHRSIPQHFSLRRALNIGRRLLRMRPQSYRYAYPSTVGDHLLLAPYYFLYPLIRHSWRHSGGSELIVYARPRVSALAYLAETAVDAARASSTS